MDLCNIIFLVISPFCTIVPQHNEFITCGCIQYGSCSTMPRYCAVANKPTIWDRENSKLTPRFSVFRFPGNKASKRKRAEAIGRNVENLNGVNCGICEKHFRPHDFRAGANRRGKDRKRRLLKKDAVPFVELATGRSTPRPTKFADPSARRLRQEQEAENRTQAFFADDQIQNLADLCQKLKKEHLPVGFRYVYQWN